MRILNNPLIFFGTVYMCAGPDRNWSIYIYVEQERALPCGNAHEVRDKWDLDITKTRSEQSPSTWRRGIDVRRRIRPLVNNVDRQEGRRRAYRGTAVVWEVQAGLGRSRRCGRRPRMRPVEIDSICPLVAYNRRPRDRGILSPLSCFLVALRPEFFGLFSQFCPLRYEFLVLV